MSSGVTRQQHGVALWKLAHPKKQKCKFKTKMVQSLSKRKYLLVLLADKGKAAVIMDMEALVWRRSG